MEITGYQLKAALKNQNLKLAALRSQFQPSLKKFPDEKKEAPQSISEKINMVEDAISKIETAQAYYNLQVKVEIAKREMTLCEAIKRVGGAGRVEKMWRDVAAKEVSSYNPYGYGSEREPGKVYSQQTITQEEALGQATKAATLASAMRAAIAEANSKLVQIDFLDKSSLG